MDASAAVLADRLTALRHARLEPQELIGQTALALREAIPSAAWCIFTTDPSTLLPTGGMVEGVPSWMCGPFWETELLDPDFNKFSVLAGSHDPVATLFEATDGEPERSPRHRILNRTEGWVDELRAAVRTGSTCWGMIVMLRGAADGPFTPAEVALLRDQLPTIGCSLRESLVRRLDMGPGPAPAVLVLDGDDAVTSMSPGAADWLEELGDRMGQHGLPMLVSMAASQARAARGAQASLRGRGRSGRWFVVDATRLADPETAGAGPAWDVRCPVAVSIRAAQPSELIRILLERFGFTEREMEVVLEIARGLPTKEIAHRLCLSVHTVRDHVKAIFEKAGVTSRGELVGRLFLEHMTCPERVSTPALSERRLLTPAGAGA